MKRTTRISALILMMALLMNLFGMAFAESEGILLEDLDLSAYQMLMSESTTETDSTTVDDPWGIGGACGEENEYCGIITNELANMNAQEIYDYLTVLYTKDLEEGEDAPSDAYAALMLHYGIYHLDMNLICICGDHPLPLPEFELSDVSAHDPECPWHFNNLTTAEQYVMLNAADEEKKAELEAALDETAAEKLSRVNVGEYTASAEAASVEINVPETAFAADYILTAGEAVLDADAEGALTEAGVTNVLASFDISFPSLQDESVELQPAEGETVPLTFTVDVTGVEGEALRVFHVKDDGSVEFVGEPVTIEDGAESVTIEVEAESFSAWGVDLWFDENKNKDSFIDTTPDYFPAIGFLDKENNDKFVFFVDYWRVPNTGSGVEASEYEKTISAADCPDYLVMMSALTSEDGSKVVYQIDSYDDYLYPSTIAYGYNYISSEYFSEVVPISKLYATIPADLSGNVELYKTAGSADSVEVSAAEIAGEYAVEAMEVGMSLYFKLTPSGYWPAAAEDYYWVMSPDILYLSSVPTMSGENQPAVDTQWNTESNEITLSYSYAGAAEGETCTYTWYQYDAASGWTQIQSSKAANLSLTVSETDFSALTASYKCIVTDASGKLVAVSPANDLVNDEIDSWLVDETDEITVTLEMAKRAFEVGALDKLRVEENELVSVYSGLTIADIVEFTEIEGISAKLVDRSMGLTVAYVTTEGTVVSVDSVEQTEVETTNA